MRLVVEVRAAWLIPTVEPDQMLRGFTPLEGAGAVVMPITPEPGIPVEPEVPRAGAVGVEVLEAVPVEQVELVEPVE